MVLAKEGVRNYPPKIELFGGPMDGDTRVTWDEEIYFTSKNQKYVNYYLKIDNKFQWQGLILWREGIKQIFRLDPGMKS